MQEMMFSFTNMLNKYKKEAAQEMFADGDSIAKIRKISKLPDEDLASVLREMPIEIQARYTMLNV